MTDAEFRRRGQSLGLECFVENYELFHNRRLKQFEIVAHLMKHKGYTRSASRTRASNARRIIEAGRSRDMLEWYIGSKNPDPELVKKARRLLGD